MPESPKKKTQKTLHKLSRSKFLVEVDYTIFSRKK